ncbi:MAG: hypothetical protein NTV32_07160 [Gammaproteobacteria bacterium]|nr:hypothetical protein [Gammaproteobacteria bacterium]
MQSVTTSVRIKPHLRKELRFFSEHSGRGMSWIIEQALDEYLKRHQKALRVEEALQDIAFLKDDLEETLWAEAYDDSGWV